MKKTGRPSGEGSTSPFPNRKPNWRSRAAYPKRVSHYEISHRLGGGGMGVVFKARDTKLDRSVALKFLPQEWSHDEIAKSRFMREASAAGSMDHPNICTVYEVGQTDDGQLFMAMPYYEGETLEARLARSSIPPELALELGRQVADGLAEAHSHAIVHRDIKPGNLMILSDEVVKIVDFGLAKLFRGTRITQQESRVGTVAYMSPEQTRGAEVDGRSDIWSLGVVLFEMLSGERPFERDQNDATIHSIRHDAPPSLPESVPRRVRQIVGKAMAKNPTDRYETAAELASELTAVSHGSSGRRLVSPGPRLARRAGAALALTVALGAWWLFSGDEVNDARAAMVSVAEFENVSGDPESDYFARGMTDALVARLSDMRGVYVIGDQGDVRVDLVLHGGVQKAGSSIQISYWLQLREDDRNIGGDVVQGAAADLFAIQENVVRGVVSLVRTHLGQPIEYRARGQPTRDVSAYDYYLRGRDYLQHYWTAENAELAIDLFRKALSKDPAFAAAHAGLGEALWRQYEITGDSALVTEARDTCEAAVGYDARLADSHLCLATVLHGTGHYQDASDRFLQAIELDPTNDDAYRGLGKALGAVGESETAERSLRYAIELHPSYFAGYNFLGGFYWREGRYLEAEREFLRAVALAPDNARSYVFLTGAYYALGRYEDAIGAAHKAIAIRPSFAAYSNLGLVYSTLRRFEDAAGALEAAVSFDEANLIAFGNLGDAYLHVSGAESKARAAFERAIELGLARLDVNPNDADAHILLSHYRASIGDDERAMAHLDEALALRPEDPEFLYWAGRVHSRLHDADAALDYLARAVEGGYSADEIANTAALDELREDPRFEKMIDGK